MKKILIFLTFINVGTIHGQDRLFTYTYQSTVLNKGQKEIESWNTYATGRSDFYARYDNRTEFEIGLGGKLQTSFYVNLSSITSTIDLFTGKALNTENELSFSNEWKLKLLDPVADPIGLALYFEYGLGSKEYELEWKVILDKRLNNVTLAANTTYELEMVPVIETVSTSWEKESKADFNLAFGYSLSNKFAITLENCFKNVFVAGSLEHSTLYSGPGISYAQENYWINFTALPQIISFKGQTNDPLNLNEFEKVQFRLLFSYAF